MWLVMQIQLAMPASEFNGPGMTIARQSQVGPCMAVTELSKDTGADVSVNGPGGLKPKDFGALTVEQCTAQVKSGV